nr:transcription factor MYB58-like isoform X2 [Malus domestica]
MRKGFYFLCQSLQKFSTLLIFLHFVGLRQCGKSCCLRWLNHLRPDIKHGSFTEEEDSTICSLYNQMGSRLSLLSSADLLNCNHLFCKQSLPSLLDCLLIFYSTCTVKSMKSGSFCPVYKFHIGVEASKMM